MRLVYCKTGRPEIANDVMGVHQTDVWTMLKPQDEWRPGLTRDALIEEIDKLLTEHVPGVKFGFSQPIEMRVNELVAGVKSDVAALIYGPDLKVLRRLSLEVERVLAQIPGRTTSRTRRRAACRCCGSRSAAISWPATGSRPPTCSTRSPRWEARRSAPCSRKTSGTRCGSASPSRGATIPTRSARSGSSIPRDARSRSRTSPKSPKRKGPARSSAKTSSTARSSGSTSGAATSPASWPRPRPRSTPTSSFPAGYLLRWGGQFEHLQTASKRLMIVVPVAMLLIFLLLYSTFHSMRLAFLIYTAVPMAATGGVFALFLRGMPFSISAGVGFIALFGVAVLNGLVWVSAVEHLRQEGVEPHEAAREAAVVRLRPILMTALVAGLGFIPMAIATTPGAEIQRPLATVVIGGIITSTLLTTLVLPAVYPWFAHKPKPVELVNSEPQTQDESSTLPAHLGECASPARHLTHSILWSPDPDDRTGGTRSHAGPCPTLEQEPSHAGHLESSQPKCWHSGHGRGTCPWSERSAPTTRPGARRCRQEFSPGRGSERPDLPPASEMPTA